MNQFKLLIQGLLCNGIASQSTIINPANETVIARAPAASKEQVDLAVKAAKSSQPAWAALPITERQAVITRITDVIAANADELAALLVAETGKPLVIANFELSLAQDFLRETATYTLPVEIIEETDEHRLELHRRPLGVAAAVVPWNFPILIGMIKLASALVAGCTLVLKPSPLAPLSLLRLGALLVGEVPAGVVNIIAGGDEVGPWLTAHPDVDKVTFTGSTGVGKAILANAASDLKRVTLELGGNDAAIVLPDADIAKVAEPIFTMAFINSGQACVGIKRLYVHESSYEPMVAALGQIASHVKVGDGMETDTLLGPVQNVNQYEKVLSVLAQAKASGARIVSGGTTTDGPGYFIAPTIVADITEGCALVDEETFGPVLPVIKYADINDAVERANRSPYGLGGSVWGGDLEIAKTIAARLECGTAWVNQHAVLHPKAPISGSKWSGLGVEGGIEGLKEFTQSQVISINKL